MIAQKNMEKAMIEVYGNKCWIDEEWIPDESDRLLLYSNSNSKNSGLEKWKDIAMLSKEGYVFLLQLKDRFPRKYAKIISLFHELNSTYSKIEPEYYDELNNILFSGEKKGLILHNGSNKHNIKQAMIKVYGNNCWMTPNWLSNKNEEIKEKRLSLHHILEKRNGGQIEWENVALLSRKEHDYLNYLDSDYNSIYKELNGLFTELNRTYSPPTEEYYDEVKYVLSKVKR